MESQPNPDYVNAPHEVTWAVFNCSTLRPTIPGFDWEKEPDGWYTIGIRDGKTIRFEWHGTTCP